MRRVIPLFGGVPYTPTFTVKYGKLYNWLVTQQTGATSFTSSDTWRVPTYTDLITKLGTYLQSNQAGDKLRETGTTYWLNANGTDTVNFHLRGGSYRASGGSFSTIKYYAFLWTSTELNTNNGYEAYVGYASSSLVTANDSKKNGNSIRLCRDASSSEKQLTDGTYVGAYTGNDGRKYPTVKIGTLIWMAENSSETKYRDGSSIAYITGNTNWANQSGAAWCYYGDSSSNDLL